MTQSPKEKADELVEAYKKYMYPFHPVVAEKQAKECALIQIKDMLQIFEGLHKPEYCAFDAIGEQKYKLSDDPEYRTHKTGYEMKEYFEQVKAELEKK